MGTAGVNASGAFKSSASACAGLMELWDGIGEILWHHQRRSHFGRGAGFLVWDAAATIARVVLRCGGQKGSASARGGCHAVFRTLVRLDRQLGSLGWHPFLRINLAGKVRPLGAERFDWLSSLVPKPGTAWSGVVDCFVERTVRCTLLACWQEGYADAWLVLTDLAPEA